MDILDFNYWSSTPTGKVILIILFYFLAWVVIRLSRRLAKYVLKASHFSRSQPHMRPERRETLQGLVAGAISFAAVAIATLISLSLFVDPSTLILIAGLFSAAFGLGARPLVSDFLSGVGFIFEDTFDVSEKVEVLGLAGGSVLGIVEAVNLRTTRIRAMSGEPCTVPNGEIRVVRKEIIDCDRVLGRSVEANSGLLDMHQGICDKLLRIQGDLTQHQPMHHALRPITF